jgi:Uma2 family endonuclease
MRKVKQYLKAGCHIVWVFFPEREEIQVWESGGSDRIFGISETLEAPELLPGFSVPVAELFE